MIDTGSNSQLTIIDELEEVTITNYGDTPSEYDQLIILDPSIEETDNVLNIDTIDGNKYCSDDCSSDESSIPFHNLLQGIQGGNSLQRYHISKLLYDVLVAVAPTLEDPLVKESQLPPPLDAILNQNAIYQTANFKINGAGTAFRYISDIGIDAGQVGTGAWSRYKNDGLAIGIDADYIQLTYDNDGSAYRFHQNSDDAPENIKPVIFDLMPVRVDHTPSQPTDVVRLSDLSAYQPVLGYTPANDNNVVHKTGNEVINNTKTFTSQINGTGIFLTEGVFTHDGVTFADVFNTNASTVARTEFNKFRVYTNGSNAFYLQNNSLYDANNVAYLKSSDIPGGGYAVLSGGNSFTGTQTINGNRILTTVDDALYLKLTGGTLSGDVQQTTSPVNGNSLITKAYVDNALTGLTWKTEVRAATTSNITLSGTQTIDGISLAVGARVLVKDQTSQLQNGIYIVATGAWTRSLDADSTEEIEGATVMVRLGTINRDTQWTNTNSNEPVIGTDAITFAQISGAGTYTNGTGITLTGNVFSLNLTYTDGRYARFASTNTFTTPQNFNALAVFSYGNGIAFQNSASTAAVSFVLENVIAGNHQIIVPGSKDGTLALLEDLTVYAKLAGGNTMSGNQSYTSGNISLSNGYYQTRDVSTGRIGQVLGSVFSDTGSTNQVNLAFGASSNQINVNSTSSLLLTTNSSGTSVSVAFNNGIATRSTDNATILWSANPFATGFNSTAVDGTGGIVIPSQTTRPATPATGFMRLYYSSNGLTWITPTGFTRSFLGTGLTADRVYTLPDVTGTLLVQTMLSATAPLTYNNSTGVFAMPQATNLQNGYLSSTDWNTFNSKQSSATTLAGYGITDAYTKTQSDSNYIQNQNSATQTAATFWIGGMGRIDSGLGIGAANNVNNMLTITGANANGLVGLQNTNNTGATNIAFLNDTGTVALTFGHTNSGASNPSETYINSNNGDFINLRIGGTLRLSLTGSNTQWTSNSIYNSGFNTTYFNTTSQTTNPESFSIGYVGNVATIASTAGTGGTVRDVTISSGSRTFNVSSAGNGGLFRFNTVATGAAAVMNMDGSLTASSGMQNYLTILPTVNQTSTSGYSLINAISFEQGLGSATSFFFRGGTSSAASGGGTTTIKYSVRNDGTINSASLTASTAVFTDASKNLVSNAISGTGSVVMTNSPVLVGTPLAPTAVAGTNTTQIATTAFVSAAIVTKALRLTASGTGSATTISVAHGQTGITSTSKIVASAGSAAAGGWTYITTDATNINFIYSTAPISGTNNLIYNIYLTA